MITSAQEHVRPALVEAARYRSVDSGRQVINASVPAHRDGARAGEDLIIVSHKVELEVWP
jgi:hypothetical protein